MLVSHSIAQMAKVYQDKSLQSLLSHHHITYFISISKTNDDNNAPEQPIDMRMKGQQG